MRRKDKAISDAAGIDAIIEKATVCRLGMVDGDTPYIIPLSFGYQDHALYFHGALRGRKMDLIKKNPNVCVEFDINVEALSDDEACDWSMRFQSVIAFGIAAFIDDLEEKRQALSVIMAHYSDKVFAFPEKMVKATAVVKVDIQRITGKQSGF